MQGFYYSHISTASVHPHVPIRHHNKLTYLILVEKNNGKNKALLALRFCSLFFSPLSVH